jgi:hypothetical protein
MRQAVVHSGQSIFDIAIQHCGDVSAAYDISVMNVITLSSQLMPGQVLKLPKVADMHIVEELKQLGIAPATAAQHSDFPEEMNGIFDYTFDYTFE